jgi:hypothetical protein
MGKLCLTKSIKSKSCRALAADASNGVAGELPTRQTHSKASSCFVRTIEEQSKR